MRVIAGTARSLQLKTVPGMDVRPTTDKIKETLFNMISPYIPECRFLDIFAGSGAIGIEAMSRGASEAVFVDQSRASAAVIADNLNHTKLAENTRILKTDAVAAINTLECEKKAFDIIFLDPPYRKELERDVLERLKDSCLVTESTQIIVEADLHTDFSYVSELGFRIVKNKEYKTNKHVFIERA